MKINIFLIKTIESLGKYEYLEEDLVDYLLDILKSRILINQEKIIKIDDLSSSNNELKVDDFVFLRPHQSEFVFLQFGNILILRNGKVSGAFSLLSQI